MKIILNKYDVGKGIKINSGLKLFQWPYQQMEKKAKMLTSA